jgi:hypothetical protein
MSFYTLNVHVDMKKIVTFWCWTTHLTISCTFINGRLFLFQRLCVTTLTLGLQPRQGHGKVQAKGATHESHTHSWECERMWGNEPTYSQVVPFWKLESRWTFEYLKSGLRGQNSLDWIFPYAIRNLLKIRCLKWVQIIHG